MRTQATWAAALGTGGALMFAWVALHEWSYREDHPYRSGPAGVIVIAALGGILASVGVALLGWALRERAE